MEKKVLITGVNGFIGQALWQYLRKNKQSAVYGISRTKKIKHSRITALDIFDSKQFSLYLDKLSPDYIFHMAGGRMINPKELFQSNIQTTETLFHALKKIKHSPRKIIIPGSAAEYGFPGPNTRRISEQYPAKPLSDYGKIKLDQTKLSMKYASQGFSVLIARIFNIIGTNTPEQLAAGRFAKQISELERKKTGAINTGSLRGRRDFLDIEDICSALWNLAESGKPGQVYNVCSSVPTKIEDLLFKLIYLSRLTDIEVFEDEHSGSKSFDVIGSNAKLKSHTKWKQKITFEESLIRTLKSWRKKIK